MSSKEKPLNEEGIKRFITGEMRKSGYSLQGKVEQKLRKDFGLKREQPFLDKDTGKSRPIDIVASALVPSLASVKEKERTVFARVDLVVECKSQPGNAWVFFPEQMPDILIPDYFSIFSDRKPDPFLKYAWPQPIREMLWMSGYVEFMFDKARSNGRVDNLYDAVSVVTKATRYEIDTLEKMIPKLYQGSPVDLSRIIGIHIILPLIVFNGKMYNAVPAEGQEPELVPLPYLQLEKRYISQNYNEVLGCIHVVSYDALDDYVGLLKKYYFAQASKIVLDQEHLKALTSRLGKKPRPFGGPTLG